MMNLDEMKLAVCEKLPELIVCVPFTMEDDYEVEPFQYWKNAPQAEIYWPTEGLQVCHEAEKLLKRAFNYESDHNRRYMSKLNSMTGGEGWKATYQQRLEALCRVWWPEQFN